MKQHSKQKPAPTSSQLFMDNCSLVDIQIHTETIPVAAPLLTSGRFPSTEYHQLGTRNFSVTAEQTMEGSRCPFQLLPLSSISSPRLNFPRAFRLLQLVLGLCPLL